MSSTCDQVARSRKNARARQGKRNKADALASIACIISRVRIVPIDRSDFLSDLSTLTCAKLREKAITIAALINPNPARFRDPKGQISSKPDAITTNFILARPVVSLNHREQSGIAGRSRFLELPAELRLRIYEYAIPQVWRGDKRNRIGVHLDTPRWQNSTQTSPFTLGWYRIFLEGEWCEGQVEVSQRARMTAVRRCLKMHGFPCWRDYLEPALLRTCRLVRKEALETYSKFLEMEGQDCIVPQRKLMTSSPSDWLYVTYSDLSGLSRINAARELKRLRHFDH